MNLYDFYRQHYFFEIERKDKLSSSVSLPIGIIALLASVISVIFKTLSLPFSSNEIFLLGLLSLAALSLVVACFYLVSSYWGRAYSYLPYSKELADFHRDLKNFYISSGQPLDSAESKSQQELSEHILLRYAEDATFNAQANNKKSSLLFSANRFIVAALVFLVPAVPSYLYQQLNTISPVYTVQLVKEATPMTQESQEQSPKPQPEQRPAELVKPTAPPSREIKEHTDKPRQK